MLGEGVLNEASDVGINLVDAVFEGLELGLPLLLVLLTEHITWERLQLLDLVLDSINLLIDLFGATGNLFKIWTKNSKEFLNDSLSFSKVFKYLNHIDWGSKDFFLGLEVPFLDCLLVLNMLFGGIEFLLPLLEHFDGLLNHLKGIFWSLHLEDLGDVDLGLDFVANLV